MNKQMGLLEFFSVEASEYLERLDALIARDPTPDTTEFVRLSRALRGSALMAKQRGFAGAAAALENLARAVSEGHRTWDEATRQLAIGAIDKFKTLLRSVSTWSSAEDSTADALAGELDRAAGRSSAAHRAPLEPTSDAGTRAFVGREAAAVASALDLAAKALQQSPGQLDAVRRAVSQMQSLRGVAGLSAMAPLPDLLEGVELAAAELERRRGNVPGAALVLFAAAQAMARVAQEITTAGRATEDSPELQEFARRLRRALDLDARVVPIEALYFDDVGPHIVREGVRPGRPGEMDRLELVSHGEHLEQAAAEMERSNSGAQRDLRAQTLAGTLRALASTGGDLFHDTVARFAHVVRDAIARGMATQEGTQFTGALRRAAALLREEGDVDQQTTALREIMRPLIGFSGERVAAAAAPVRPTTEPPDAPIRRPRAISAPTEPPRFVPERTTARQRGAPAAPQPVAAAPPDEPASLAGSWRRYERLVGALGKEGGSLDELFAGPVADPAASAALSIVSIDELLYRGRAALDRADAVRLEVEKALNDGESPSDVRELIEEVLDLVALARTDG